jgi:hypothetical protein
MNVKDKLFISLSVILIILFAVVVLEKSLTSAKHHPGEPGDEAVSKIEADLRTLGLEPKEAAYYKVIDE